MARIQFGKGDRGPSGPRSPLPNWILAIFLVQFFNQTRVIFSSLVRYLLIAALASPWLLWVKELKESRLKPRSFQLLQAIDCLYLKVSRLPYYIILKHLMKPDQRRNMVLKLFLLIWQEFVIKFDQDHLFSRRNPRDLQLKIFWYNIKLVEETQLSNCLFKARSAINVHFAVSQKSNFFSHQN